MTSTAESWDRLVPLPIQGRRIDFFTASLEDIVVAKLYSDRDTEPTGKGPKGNGFELCWSGKDCAI